MLADRVRHIVSLTGKEILEDGLRFETVGVADGQVKVAMLIDPSACAECIVPDETLSQILLHQIQKKFPIIHSVEIVRREIGGAPAREGTVV